MTAYLIIGLLMGIVRAIGHVIALCFDDLMEYTGNVDAALHILFEFLVVIFAFVVAWPLYIAFFVGYGFYTLNRKGR